LVWQRRSSSGPAENPHSFRSTKLPHEKRNSRQLQNRPETEKPDHQVIPTDLKCCPVKDHTHCRQQLQNRERPYLTLGFATYYFTSFETTFLSVTSNTGRDTVRWKVFLEAFVKISIFQKVSDE
jgi:hypothetical protein